MFSVLSFGFSAKLQNQQLKTKNQKKILKKLQTGSLKILLFKLYQLLNYFLTCSIQLFTFEIKPKLKKFPKS